MPKTATRKANAPVKAKAVKPAAVKAKAPAKAPAKPAATQTLSVSLTPRQAQAIEFVKKNGGATVAQLNAYFGVSSSRLHVLKEGCAKLGIQCESRKDGRAVVWFIPVATGRSTSKRPQTAK